MGKTETFELVKEYLLRNRFTYGTAISTLDLMEEAGIVPKKAIMPARVSKSRMTEIEYLNEKYLDDHIAYGKVIADEMLIHLREFGFAADRVPRADHNNSVVHMHGCTVYTRFPWDVAYKAKKAAEMSETFMGMIHDSNVDMDGFNTISPVISSHMKLFLNEKLARGIDFRMNNNKMWKKFDNFHKLMSADKDELVKVFKTMRPSNYGVYLPREES